MSLEMLELEHGVTGIALNLEEDNVGVALFGDWRRSQRAGRSSARATSSASRWATSSSAASSNPLGEPLDGAARSVRPRPACSSTRRPASSAGSR